MAFDPDKRKIFLYHDGTSRRGIDPLEADIAIEAVDLDWEAKVSLAKIGDADSIRDIILASRKIFGVSEFRISDDGKQSGLSSMEVLAVLTDFMAWKQSLMGFTAPPQTGEQSTAAEEQSTAETSPLTKSGTDSTSTSPANSPATVSA